LKEAGQDAANGDLTPWAEQGVLLLNRIMTVELGKPLSHKDKGWEIFLNNVIEFLNINKPGLIYMLWGKKAEKLKDLIDTNKNTIMIAGHPSPLNRKKSFRGCGHFGAANLLLEARRKAPINWRI